MQRIVAIAVVSVAMMMVWMHAAGAETVSCYGPESGPMTASGEPFNPWGHTAAHPFFPFGTLLLIEWDGKAEVVRVNDRGNYGGRWDLAMGSCYDLGIAPLVGVADVKVTPLYIP